MGRLIHNARRVTTLRKMKALINPKKYMETVKAVKSTCGYDSETNKFLIPSPAYKLGHALVKASKLLKAQGFMSNNKELVKSSSEFQEVHQEKWNSLISATALRNIREAKWNVPTHALYRRCPTNACISQSHAHRVVQFTLRKSLFKSLDGAGKKVFGPDNSLQPAQGRRGGKHVLICVFFKRLF